MKQNHVCTPNAVRESSPDIRKKIKRFEICVFLISLHSLTLGSFIFFFTDSFYYFFFGVAVDNPFLIKQAGLFLFCLGLFYMAPIGDLVNKHRIVDLIIVTKVLAFIFLITNASLFAKPGPILLAALGDGIMGIVLIFYSLTSGLFFKKSSTDRV